MKTLQSILFLVFLLVAPPLMAAEEPALTPEEEKYIQEAKRIWNSLDRKTGDIVLPGEVASLKVPESFYYLNPGDTATVLVDVWGNPPEAALNLLGMLFPAGSTPFDNGAWGVTIGYEEDGYVSDEDADEIDYSELLEQMKEDTREASELQVQQGYSSVELVGWAAKPFYDKQSHKLHWAKEIKFGDSAAHTLNYNIRVLGRKGVLVLNFIAGMEQKKIIDSNLDIVLAMADFNQGSRYQDFVPGVDKVAAYGIGALVAGKVLAKTGALAAIIIFLKKFGIYIVVAAGALLGKLFKKKKPEEETPAT